MKGNQFHFSQLSAEHVRNAWQPDTDDLHMNVIVLRSGECIGNHVNQLLDVIVTCLRGKGIVFIGDQRVDMESGSIVLIPQGASREIRAGTDGMIYTTVHRKRGGIMPTIRS